jgi:hypothetical protein
MRARADSNPRPKSGSLPRQQSLQNEAILTRKDRAEIPATQSSSINDRDNLLDDKFVFVKTTELLRFDGAVERDPAIDAWMKKHAGELGAIAHRWFEVMRKCGDEVRELMHDGCPVACLGDVPFGYVNVFASHVNVGFFRGASLPDPGRLLQGSGRYMRHVKLKPGAAVNDAALRSLIDAAYSDIKARVENG